MLGYDDTVRITRATPGTGAANSGKPQGGASTVLYDGSADVQNGAQTLQQMEGDAAERSDANAAVFFPPAGAVAFSKVRTGDAIETPIGSGTVVEIRHTDAALAVRLDRTAGAVPVIL